MNYQPKGGMCASCKKKADDCSKLEFWKMRVYQTDGKTNIVICSKFAK